MDPNLVVADRFEHQDDFLARGKHRAGCETQAKPGKRSPRQR
jgi:hypothetical protein